jgi:hypothetical protein
MIAIERKKLEQVLDDLICASSYCNTYDAIDVVKEALAQPAQEPVLEPACPVCSATPTFSLDVRVNEWSGQCKRCGVEGSPTTTEADAKRLWIVWHHKKLYTTPPKRPWVGLVEKEIDYLLDLAYASDEEFLRTIEATLKEKNT